MMLQDDLKSENSNVKVRPIPGLEEVNYLYPSFLTDMVAYVFGPLIQYLVQEGGYVANVALEARDQCLTKTLLHIEEMHQLCGRDKPIVLLGHSPDPKWPITFSSLPRSTKDKLGLIVTFTPTCPSAVHTLEFQRRR